jgi:hypothetical protein
VSVKIVFDSVVGQIRDAAAAEWFYLEAAAGIILRGQALRWAQWCGVGRPVRYDGGSSVYFRIKVIFSSVICRAGCHYTRAQRLPVFICCFFAFCQKRVSAVCSTSLSQ